mmetsp:Transcript_1044/g.2169  ORF Transcript_1044/g.2169 Transcript_1044/m.2169 type:complete len:383 (+) Transcript_1044:970-2118(+)
MLGLKVRPDLAKECMTDGHTLHFIRRINDLANARKLTGQDGELRPHGVRLQGAGLASTAALGLVAGVEPGGVVAKAEAVGPVVNPDPHGTACFVIAAAGDNGLLDLGEGDPKAGSQRSDMVEGDGVVRGAEGADELQEEDGGHRTGVAGQRTTLIVLGAVRFLLAVRHSEPRRLGPQAVQKGTSLRDQNQWVRIFLQEAVQLPQVRRDVVHDPLGPDLAQQGLARRVASVETQQGRHPRPLLLGDVVLEGGGDGRSAVPVVGARCPLGIRRCGSVPLHRRGDAQGAQQDRGRLEGPGLGRHAAVVLAAEGVELVPGECVEQVVLGHPEELGELLVVRGHKLCLGHGAGGHGASGLGGEAAGAGVGNLEDVVDVLNSAEALGV